MKFSALNVDFSSLGPNLLRSTRLALAGVKDGHPFKKWWFCAIRLSSLKRLADRHRRATYYNKHW